MQPSSFATYTIPAIGAVTPTALAKASAHIPMRVLVNNVGPVVVFVARETTDLTPQPSTSTYRIFPGEQHAFVLAPQQTIYALGAGAGGRLSVATSEALPVG